MFRIGVDIGGTFTDLYALDESNPTAAGVRTAKVLSTPEDLSLGVLNALRRAGIAPHEISTIVHGTTVATQELRLGEMLIVLGDMPAPEGGTFISRWHKERQP